MAVALSILAASQTARSQGVAAAPGGQPPGGESPAAKAPISPERIAMLEKSLSGCTLVGQFTINGRGDMRPSAERYELTSVKHLQGDMWLITARIKYGEHDVTVPLPLPIRWAGDDTPVITLDEFSVPGMGTYSARVMIYKDKYMGYWSAQDHGGYLFGAVEHPKGQEAPAEAPPSSGGAPAGVAPTK